MSPSGEEAVGPSWPVVLRYELEVRKEAMRQINMFGVSLATAFAAGRRSDELRTRYLVTPLVLRGTQKKQQDNRPAEERSQKQKVQQPRQQPSTQSGPKRKGAKQRAAKRQSKAGSTLTQPSSRYNKARRLCPDAFHQIHNGKSICFAFQSPKGCWRGQSSKHQHICAHCFGAHPYEKCPINVESRAAYLKQRLHSVRFARRSHNSAISSQKEGTVGVPTVPAVLLPTSASMQSQTSLLVQDEGVGVGIPTPTITVSPSVLSPSFPLVEGDVSKRTVSDFSFCPQWSGQCGNSHTARSESRSFRIWQQSHAEFFESPDFSNFTVSRF